PRCRRWACGRCSPDRPYPGEWQLGGSMFCVSHVRTTIMSPERATRSAPGSARRLPTTALRRLNDADASAAGTESAPMAIRPEDLVANPERRRDDLQDLALSCGLTHLLRFDHDPVACLRGHQPPPGPRSLDLARSSASTSRRAAIASRRRTPAAMVQRLLARRSAMSVDNPIVGPGRSE